MSGERIRLIATWIIAEKVSIELIHVCRHFKCNHKHSEGARHCKYTQSRQNTYRKGVRPPQDRSMHGQIVLMQIVSRITFDIIWSLYEPFLRQFRRQLMWRRSRTYPPMRYTVDFRQLEPSLTRTSRLLEPKSISPGFSSYIYCNCTLRNSTSR